MVNVPAPFRLSVPNTMTPSSPTQGRHSGTAPTFGYYPACRPRRRGNRSRTTRPLAADTPETLIALTSKERFLLPP